MRALHTPGHRPEHTAFALVDTARSDEPWAVLSGDSLFVGDIARPDLAVEKRDGARADLPLAPRPAADAARHVRGVAGASRRLALRRPGDGSQGRLDDRVRARRPAAAPGARRGGVRAPRAGDARPAAAELPATSSRSTAARSSRRAWTRIRSRPGRSSWRTATARSSSTSAPSCSSTRRTSPARSASPRGGPASAPSWPGSPSPTSRSRSSAATTTTRSRPPRWRPPSGSATIAGFLSGGMTSWREEKFPVEAVERMTVPELHERWERNGVQLLDVRERSEWEERPHPRLRPRPLPRHPRRPGRPRPASARSRRSAAPGQRAAVAASLLKRHGADRRDPRRRRRHRHLGARRLADRALTV